jgi:hypothetical protein
MYLLYISSLSSTHLWLRCSNFFNPSKKIFFGCDANRKQAPPSLLVTRSVGLYYTITILYQLQRFFSVWSEMRNWSCAVNGKQFDMATSAIPAEIQTRYILRTIARVTACRFPHHWVQSAATSVPHTDAKSTVKHHTNTDGATKWVSGAQLPSSTFSGAYSQ